MSQILVDTIVFKRDRTWYATMLYFPFPTVTASSHARVVKRCLTGLSSDVKLNFIDVVDREKVNNEKVRLIMTTSICQPDNTGEWVAFTHALGGMMVSSPVRRLAKERLRAEVAARIAKR